MIYTRWKFTSIAQGTKMNSWEAMGPLAKGYYLMKSQLKLYQSTTEHGWQVLSHTSMFLIVELTW